MASLFSASNSLNTEMGQIIERSINPYNPEPSLELFFEISDLINLKEENARDAFKAIKKELSIYKGKNWFVVNKILILLETCVNNCNKKFQINLSNKEFLLELKSMIGPKLQPPIEIQEKVLYLIQQWNNMFKNDPDFKNIESFYFELRQKGVDFPIENKTSFDKLLDPSINKLNKSLKISSETSKQTSDSNGVDLNISPHHHQHQQRSGLYTTPKRPVGIIKLNDEQIAKLNSELSIVDSNVQVFNEIMTELQSSNSNKTKQRTEDLIILRELSKTCKEMQKRITQLIGNISNETVINELLRINDDLNNVFLRYDRFDRTNKSPNESNVLKENQVNLELNQEKELIDFSDDLPSNSKLTSSNLNNNNSNQKAALDGLSFLGDENEIKEMENWLKSQEINDKK